MAADQRAMQLYSSNNLVPYQAASAYHVSSYRSASADMNNRAYGNSMQLYENASVAADVGKEKSGSSWSFRPDAETKRKIRVASYKVYAVERKMKTSVKNGFRWIKDKYYDLKYRWW